MCHGAGRAVIRKTILFAILCVLLVIYCHPGVNKWSYERIQPGMTHEQVCQILGQPKYADYPLRLAVHGTSCAHMAQWQGSDLGVRVYFDIDGKVVHKFSYPGLYEFERDSKLQQFLRSWGMLAPRVRE